MKKLVLFILAAGLAISISSVVSANCQPIYQLVGREISPGIDFGDLTAGALFVGKFFDCSGECGKFTISLSHNGTGIEECGGETTLVSFKLVMNFNSGARLVLVGPVGGSVSALWNWDDPECPAGNCSLTDEVDYGYYIDLFDERSFRACADDEYPDFSFIAAIDAFPVARQALGSHGINYKNGLVSGYLVHTPVVSPAIFGTVSLSQ